MNYYDMNAKEMETRGIDYDLGACLEYNPQEKYTIGDIDYVVGVAEGERDESSWYWILKLKKAVDGNRYVYLTGWCDYTGWDCRSGAASEYAKTAKKALALLKIEADPEHYKYSETKRAYETLSEQIKTRKKRTWREENNKNVPAIKELPTSQ